MNVVVFTTSENVAPTLASAMRRFANTRSACARKSPAPTSAPVLSNATWPAMWTVRPSAATTTCVYPVGLVSPGGLM